MSEFTQIPAGVRIPGTFVEFSNARAGVNSFAHNYVIFAQRLDTGTVSEGIPTRVTRGDQAGEYFGRGSMAHAMASAALNANPWTQMWVIALDDASGGQAAKLDVPIPAAATAAGTAVMYIGNTRVAVGVTNTDTVNTIAANLTAAINANLDLEVTASVATDTITITARHKGEVYNGLRVSLGIYGEQQPAGLVIDTGAGALAGGTGSPDIVTALDALGDEWKNWITNPFTDAFNLSQLDDELKDRFSAMRSIGCRAFTALPGTHAATATWGAARNCEHVTTMGIADAQTPAHIWSAVVCAVAANALAIDPARPLQTLELPGVIAGPKQTRWTDAERNLLLWDGISTHKVDHDGTVRIERLITNYQKNSAGFDDASYLDINTPETLERIRWEQRAFQAQRYPRHKLADDGNKFGPGQPIMTPKIWKGELIGLYKTFINRGWCEDLESYKETLDTWIGDPDKNLLIWKDQPNLVNQARVFAGLTEFVI